MKQIRKRKIWTLTFGKVPALFFSLLLMGGCFPINQMTPPNNLSSPAKNNGSGVTNTMMQEGTKVDELDLSGVPVSEAPEKLESWAKDKLEETRVLLYNETEIPITLKDLGVSLDTQKTLEGTKTAPGTVQPTVLKVDSVKAGQAIGEKLKKFARPAKDAAYKVVNDKVVITPAENGRAVALDQLLKDIQMKPLSKVPDRIEIPMTDVPASLTTEGAQNLAFDSVIGEFTTKFSVSEKNRTANLKTAAKAINGKVIRPGETFSFNNTVGPREPSTGYKDAYIIINGEYVKGTGGGICQVSSTLYNAVLLSDLKIVERKPHDVAVSYVSPGQDATVNYPNTDLKFNNDTASLVYIRTEVKPGALTIRIWGKKTGKSVRIERQIVKTKAYSTERRLDYKLRPGQVKLEQKGTQGVVVNIWKVIKDSNGQETKQFLGRDSYAPANRILRVGR